MVLLRPCYSFIFVTLTVKYALFTKLAMLKMGIFLFSSEILLVTKLPKCFQIWTNFSEIQQKNMCTDELFYPTNSARVFRVGSLCSRWPDFLVRCHHTTAEEEGAGLKGAVNTWWLSIAVTVSLFLSSGCEGRSFGNIWVTHILNIRILSDVIALICVCLLSMQ